MQIGFKTKGPVTDRWSTITEVRNELSDFGCLFKWRITGYRRFYIVQSFQRRDI
jgi:hypothetical protein